MKINERFHILLGHDCLYRAECPKCNAKFESVDRIKNILCPECSFDSIGVLNSHDTVVPNYFSDTKIILEEMRLRKDWLDFVKWCTDLGFAHINDYGHCYKIYWETDIICNKNGKLLKLAIDWIEERSLKIKNNGN